MSEVRRGPHSGGKSLVPGELGVSEMELSSLRFYLTVGLVTLSSENDCGGSHGVLLLGSPGLTRGYCYKAVLVSLPLCLSAP